MKMPRMQACVDMFLAVVGESIPALLILVFMSAMACVLFASCMWFAEGTRYVINDTYPDGAYVRPDYTGYRLEVTPFKSILSAFWWFFTTATTVGYGDEYPTTTPGRIVGVLSFYVGIMLLALPVGIIGGSFGKHYPLFVKLLQDMVIEKKSGSDLRA